MVREKIKTDLKKVIKKSLKIEPKEIHLEHPENPDHGDYASNFAMVNFERLKTMEIKNPLGLAKKITKNFPKKDYLKRVEAVKPGFINFYLSEKFFQNQAKQILKQKEKFGSSDLGKGKKVIIEFGQPNTHKLPHIGHFRSYAIGESIARLLEFTDFNVFRANYQGDVGLHVAKCLWGYQKKNQKLDLQEKLQEKIKLLQESYVYGSRMYEEDEKARKEIDELNLKIYKKDKSIIDLWQKTRKWSLAYYHLMNERLGTKYDREYFESEAAKIGKKIVLENTNRVFEKSKGAIIFPGRKYGLHDRVFVTSVGLPTYEAKDLGLIFLKKQDFDYDLSLISTASEQIEYFKVVYKAAEQIVPKEAKKFTHIPFGLVSLTGAKLSSRKGKILSIDELLEKVEEALTTVMEEKGYPKGQIKKVVDDLVIGASKYSILKHTPIKNIVFDIKQSVALEGNSGPYLQYTNARAQSILRKSKMTSNLKLQKNWPLESEGLSLLKLLYQFPEVVEKATKNYSPNLICNYLFELAQKFNKFYESCPVLKAKTKALKTARLASVKATSQVLKNGLNLLGIPAPEKM